MRQGAGRLVAWLVVSGAAVSPLLAQTSIVNATIATIPTALAPVGIGVSADGRLLYVAERESELPRGPTVCPAPPGPASTPGQIEVFDTATRTRVAVRDGGAIPRDAAVDPARGVSYIAHPDRPDLDVVQTATGVVLRTIATGLTQADVNTIDTARQRLYVVGTGADEIVNNRIANQRVRAIDLATERPVGDIVFERVTDARVDPATGRLWVLSSDTDVTVASVSHAVVFDPNTLAELARIPVGYCASGLALDTARQLAYVTNGADRSISVIDMTKVPARPGALAAPGDLRAIVNGTTVAFTWARVPGAASYDLEVGSQRGTTNLIVLNTSGLGLTATLPQGTYYFRVRAKLPTGAASDPSNEIAVTTAVEGQLSIAAGGSTGMVGSGALPARQLATVVQPRAVACGYTVAPVTSVVGAAGGTLTISVADPQGTGCAWSVLPGSASEFLVVTSGASGVGAGSVAVTVPAIDGDSRIGTLRVDEVVVTVMQCAHAVTPVSASVDAGGGSLAFAVTTRGGCDWTASSHDGFLLLNSGTAGSGNGTVHVTAAVNTGAARSGTVTIAGHTLTVTQAGAGGECAYAVTPGSATAPAAGGALNFTITTQTDCPWTAASNSGFLTMTGATSGSGSSTVTVTAAGNSGAVRSGTVTIANQSLTVTQDAVGAPSCALSVAPANISVPAASGTLTLTVNRTQGAGCNWTAASNTSFLSISGPTAGVDDAPIVVSVSANAGALRSGTLTIAGRTVTVTQDGTPSPSCTYVVWFDTAPVRHSGARTHVSVSVAQGTDCAWTAVSHAGFLTVSGMPPMTGGQVEVTVAPNTGVARSGTLTVAGQTVTLNQASFSPSCGFDVSQTAARPTPASGGTTTFTVTNTLGVDCSWTATSNSAFLTIQSGSSGIGSGSVTAAASANTGAARLGTLTIAGRTMTVEQEGMSGCAFDVTPTNVTVPQPSGGTVTFTVVSTGATNCGWTALSLSPFLTIVSGSSGTGSGSVTVQAAASSVPLRSGTLLIAGREVTVNQEGRVCAFDVTPVTTTVAGSGGAATFTVNNSQGTSCGWAAVSNSAFLTVTSGSQGTGSGSVTVTAASNSGASRSGTVTIAEKVVTIVQDAAGCAFDVSPTAATVAAAGGNRTFTVTNTQGADCSWTAASNSAFLTITSGSAGTGSGSVTVTASVNTGAARPGTVTIAGRTITITQDATVGCEFRVDPSSIVVSSNADTKTFTVTHIQGATCGWTAVSNSAFLTVTGGSSGTGSSAVTVAIAAHSGTVQRSGTLTIAGRTVTVTQDPPSPSPVAPNCAFTVAPPVVNMPAAGGTTTFTVTQTAGTECTWAAVSNDPRELAVIGGASGIGSGTVTVSVAVYESLNASRQATLTIAGKTVTVVQPPTSCSFSVTPSNVDVPASGGTATFTVTPTPIGCTWRASTSAGFLTITSGAEGKYSGTVTVSAAANSGAARSGALTIAGHTVTVTQPSTTSCVFSVTPATATVGASGGTATFTVTNTQGSGCSWTASTSAGFLTITGGASGTGNGTVTVSAAANSGAARSGAVTIAGTTLTVTQAAPPVLRVQRDARERQHRRERWQRHVHRLQYPGIELHLDGVQQRRILHDYQWCLGDRQRHRDGLRGVEFRSRPLRNTIHCGSNHRDDAGRRPPLVHVQRHADVPAGRVRRRHHDIRGRDHAGHGLCVDRGGERRLPVDRGRVPGHGQRHRDRVGGLEQR